MTCPNPKFHPEYVFGSAIITLVVGSLSFLTAIMWGSAIQKAIEYYETKHDAVETRFSFAFLITAISLLAVFATVYFISGERI